MNILEPLFAFVCNSKKKSFILKAIQERVFTRFEGEKYKCLWWECSSVLVKKFKYADRGQLGRLITMFYFYQIHQ